ncbi:MAG TPA: hypothetical protein VIS74_06135 [Chthoniobacterales bacterium]
MKLLIFIGVILLGAAGWLGYDYVSKHPKLIESLIPPRDSQGRLLVDCPHCQAAGTVKCGAPRCKNGRVNCPGPCLKLSTPGWKKHPLPGYDPDTLWHTFNVKGGEQRVSQGHIGEVFEVKNGVFANLGKCKVCQGTTTVDCKICAGTGAVACPVCKGAKRVSDTGNPPARPNVSPSAPVSPPPASLPPAAMKIIRFKNGRTLEGTIIIRDEKTVWIRTRSGEKIQVPAADLILP